jgi:hypothetical protein
MKKLFYFGIGSLVLFELAKVYFIMPMPGSQKADTLEIAYFLHIARWYIRSILLILILSTFYQTTRQKAWIPLIFVGLAAVIIYYTNFRLSADSMFLQPSLLTFKTAPESQVDSSRLVLGITHMDQAKAYPIQYLGYHHRSLIPSLVNLSWLLTARCAVPEGFSSRWSMIVRKSFAWLVWIISTPCLKIRLQVAGGARLPEKR